MKRAFLILVDGLRADVAEAEMAAGHLPNLAALTDTGARTRAITVFPSITSVAYLPFLTGCFPGRCNVPSIRWLDRMAYTGRWWKDRAAVRSYCGYQAGMLDDDIAPQVQTIFQLVPESMALFTMITRGLTPERDPAQGARRNLGSLAHYTEKYDGLDRRVARGLMEAVEQSWRFVFAQFPGVDGYTHAGRPDGVQVIRALQSYDQVIGQLVRRLEQRGELDDTLIALVSDHGATPVHTHLDLANWFRGQGVPTMAHPVVWARNPRAAVMVAGNSFASVYARPGIPRAERWSLEQLRQPDSFGTKHDVVTALVHEAAVAFVAGGDGNGGVRLASATGEAVITRSGDAIRYSPLSGDPLELGAPFTGDRDAWLAYSFDTAYPEAPVHLLDQFAAPRAGDLVIAAREGYDFRGGWEIPEHKSGHGSLIHPHMHTPLWSNHPVPAEPLRTADVFAALLDWLDVPLPEGIDARPVWRPSRTAPARAPRQRVSA
jgi:hypothetical protein